MSSKPESTLSKIREMIGEVREAAVAKIEDYAKKAETSQEEINAQLASINEQFDARMKDVEAKIAERGVSVPGVDEGEQKFSFAKAFGAMRSGAWAGAGYEKEVMEETAKKRSNSAGEGSEGGFLIPEEVSESVIELALANMPLNEMGMTTLPGLTGNLSIPKTTGRPTGYWIGENAVPTESDTTFGEIKLDPKRVAGFTKVSDRLMRQAPGVVEPIIRKELANAIMLALQTAIIEGSGSEFQPKGVVNFSGLTDTDAIGVNGGRFTVGKAAEMITNVEEADHPVEASNFGFLMRPVVLEGMKMERVAQFTGDTQGTYVFSPPIISNKQIQEMVGYPIKTTSLVANNLEKGTSSTCSYVIAGDWAQVLLALWTGMEIKVSDTTAYSTQSAFLQNQMWLVAQQEVDVNIKDVTGLTVIRDAEALRSAW